MFVLQLMGGVAGLCGVLSVFQALWLLPTPSAEAQGRPGREQSRLGNGATIVREERSGLLLVSSWFRDSRGLGCFSVGN